MRGHFGGDLAPLTDGETHMATLHATTERQETFAHSTDAEKLIRAAEAGMETGVVMRWARRAGFMEQIQVPHSIAPAA